MYANIPFQNQLKMFDITIKNGIHDVDSMLLGYSLLRYIKNFCIVVCDRFWYELVNNYCSCFWVRKSNNFDIIIYTYIMVLFSFILADFFWIKLLICVDFVYHYLSWTSMLFLYVYYVKCYEISLKLNFMIILWNETPAINL